MTFSHLHKCANIEEYEKNQIFLIFCLFISIPAFSGAQKQDEFLRIPIPGRVEGKGTHFEIKDSDYLNITLESEKEIEVVLESIPRVISLNISSSTQATTTLTLRGLEPNKKYFKYEDTHKNETEFFTDQSGSYSWQQDLTNPHHIWIQEIKGTIYLSGPEDCTSTIGIWNELSRTCTLIQDVTTSVEIATSNITLDCNENNHYSITGNGTDYGVLIIGKENVTIKNCKISNFSAGLYLENSSNIHLIENDVSYNTNGISLSFSTRNELENNKVTHNKYSGIFLYFSSQNKLKNNFVADNNSGIYLQYSGKNLLRGNRMENNEYNFGIYVWFGIYSSQILGEINDVDDSNTVDGKPIYYWVNKHDLTIPSNGGCVILVNSSNITVKGLEIKNNSHGILLINTSSSTITENNLENNLNGLVLSFDSNNNQIIGNRINKNSFGLEIHKSSGNLVRKNKITNNGSFTTGGYGIFLYVSSGNVLIENEISNNNISTSTIGLLLLYSDSNRIYHNNFINNSHQISSDGYLNFFDNGYPSGGNYWSDYSGRDEKWGKDQEQNGSDGIGDTPYIFSGGQDRYPFMRENGWILPKVLISEVYYDVAEGKGRDPYNEWIIIHNSEEREIDISGWKICDNYSCEPLPSIVLLPKSFTIVTASSTTFDFWRIPKGMTKIVLSTKIIGNGLADGGDRVILKDKEGKIVDAMSYGDNTFVFFPECTKELKAKEGKSLLRNPPYKDTDTCEDFIESEPTIGKNWLPIPIINFSPKNPVKGVKVKFDASSSTDPDGEIKEFFWEIKREEEILAISTATTTTFAFPENGEYQITLTATDEDGATSSTSTIIKVEPFSFAIITDLHIGRGYPDYDGPGFDDGYNGEEYYLTQRLRNVVNWIIQNKENYSFKFVAVLGDIADTAEKSEFCKAKEILDELEIPYIPIFGNHDVWPYTEKESTSTTLGEDFFERIFWSTTSIPCENASSTRNFEILLREFSFERDIQNPKFKNFIFNYGGINFIGLDFNSREKACKKGCGVKGEAVDHSETINWLKNRLANFSKDSPIILFSHHPITKSGWEIRQGRLIYVSAFSPEELEELKNLLQNYNVQLVLSGHVHGFEKFGKEAVKISPLDIFFTANWLYSSLPDIPVLTTEALMVGSNENDEVLEKSEFDKGIVRVVKIFDSNNLNFGETAAKYSPQSGEGKEFIALNPYISWTYKFLENSSNPCIFLKSHPFTNRDISSFEWDLGNGEKRYGKVIPLYCYSATGTYTITSTVTDAKTGWQEWITRKIEIKEGLFSKIIKIKNEFKEKTEIISQKIGENLLGFRNYLIKGKDRILLKIKHSPSIPVAELTIDFDETTGDIDLSQMIFDSNLKEKKSILYIPEWPKVVKEKILLLPK